MFADMKNICSTFKNQLRNVNLKISLLIKYIYSVRNGQFQILQILLFFLFS